MMPAELLKKGQSFYRVTINREPSEEVIAQFMAVCRHFAR